MLAACLFLSFTLSQVEYNCKLIKVDWLAASIALKVVGAVPNPVDLLTEARKTGLTAQTLISQRKLALTARNAHFTLQNHWSP
jgi:hypothetical protein